MNNTTVVLAVVVFALVGTMVFAAVAPYLYEADARGPPRGCPINSPDSDGPENGCGPRKAMPCHPPECKR